MNGNFFRGLVVSLFAVGLGAAVHAQEPDRLVVNIPYDFVVNGKTLPAGKYAVKRNHEREMRILSISNVENHSYIVVLSTAVNYAREFHPGVTLLRVGDQNVLTKIRTAEHIFTIPVSRADSQSAATPRGTYLIGMSETTR